MDESLGPGALVPEALSRGVDGESRLAMGGHYALPSAPRKLGRNERAYLGQLNIFVPYAGKIFVAPQCLSQHIAAKSTR